MMARTYTRRRPRLKVVAHSLQDAERHVTCLAQKVAGGLARDKNFIIEVWTFAEWDRLHPSERPENAAFLPGVGHVELRLDVPEEEYEDIRYNAQRRLWEMEDRGGA